MNDSAVCRVDAVSPLRLSVVEHEIEIRGFDAAVNQLFHGEDDLAVFFDRGVLQSGFLCSFDIDISAVVNHFAGLCVDFITELVLFDVKFQNPARTSRISAQYFIGKHDFDSFRNFRVR